MPNLFNRLNSRRSQRLAAAQIEQVPAEISKPKKKKTLFGNLLEKAGSWVKPKGSAKTDAQKLNGNPEWEDTRNLDLSEQQAIPRNFKAPFEVEKIRFNYDADQKGGIANDPALLKTLPAERPIQAEFTISTKQIFNLLQKDPAKLTPEMARVITGSKPGIKGLGDEQLFKALHRLERKFAPADLDKIPVEVKNILLNKLKSSSDPNIWKQTLKLKEFLSHSTFEALATESSKPDASKKGTQSALKKELRLLKEELERPAELLEITSKSKVDVEQIAKKLIEQNLSFIKTRTRQGASSRPDVANRGINKTIDKILDSVKDTAVRKSMKDAALRSLQRLETRFETTGTEAAKQYVRLTSLNEGSKEKLLYATAMMERDSGLIPSSKKYDIKKLAI